LIKIKIIYLFRSLDYMLNLDNANFFQLI